MRKYIAMAAVAMMFAACSNDDMPEVPTLDEMADTPITLTAGVADLTTRAGHPTGELKTGSLGFYMTTEGTVAEKYTAENREFSYNATNGWTVTGNTPLLWMNTTAAVSYTAYHPYSSEVTNKILSVAVPTDQNVSVVDLLYTNGTTDGGKSSEGIALALNHMMAKLTIELRAGTELAETPEFSNVVIRGLKNTCGFDLTTGNWNDFSKYTTATDVALIKNSGNNFEAIVIPQELAEFIVLITISDGRTFRFSQAAVELKTGTAYTLNLVVGKDKVELADDGITVSDWTESAVNDFVTD